MKLINIHNHHALPGGMEVIFAALTRLFRERGNEVVELSRNNSELKSLWQKLGAFGGAIYSPSTYRMLKELLDKERPQIAHVHNLYPQFSTSALDALYDAGVPVILHAQDYKLTCPTAQHLRKGKICEKCLNGREFYAAIHNCRGSVPMSVAYAMRNTWARWSGSVKRGVSIYACPTKFVADLLIRGGLPQERVRVIYNYCDLPESAPRSGPGEYVGYLGRISPEKGIDVLIDAARRTGIPTRIAGDPSPMPELQENLPANVEFVGKLSREGVATFLEGVRVLVVPSVWYEAFGLVCVEALSRGIPVIASDIGGLPEVVHHGKTGLLTPPGNATSLAESLQTMWDDPSYAQRLGAQGRQVVRERFSADAFYRQVSGIWSELLSPTQMPESALVRS